jgi:hypothetical protein
MLEQHQRVILMAPGVTCDSDAATAGPPVHGLGGAWKFFACAHGAITISLTQSGQRDDLHDLDALFMQPHDLFAPLVQSLQCLILRLLFPSPLDLQTRTSSNFTGPDQYDHHVDFCRALGVGAKSSGLKSN